MLNFYVCMCLYIVHCSLYQAFTEAWPTVPATSPDAWMIGLIVIDNQPIHGPCVTTEFSVTGEPSCVGVCVGGGGCGAGGGWDWGFGGGQAC